MGKKKSALDLGRRERQILDVIYQLGEASVSDVLKGLPDPPSYSAIRTMIRLLERKGFLRHRRDGTRYVYRPTQSKKTASRSALRHLIKTFFAESPTDVMAAIFDVTSDDLTDADLSRIERMIDEARKEGR